jgi:hypothetical protein
MFGWLERILCNWEPAKRRRAAVEVLGWSVVLMFVNVALYVFRVIDESMLILITLILSWLALVISAADVVATNDVREEADL